MTDYEETEDPQEDWAGFSGAQTDIEDQSLHPAVLTELTRKVLPSAFDPSGKAPAIIWTFALEDIEGQTVDGTTSEATGPKSKARPWIEALVGKANAVSLLRAGNLKTGLIGRQCQVLIAINDNGYPKVAAVLPAQGAKKAPDIAPAPVEPPRAVLDAPGASDELRCEEFGDDGRCVRPAGHEGAHRVGNGATWK